jgi:DeoR/GlpR family transcriptional regulator of sugar metabolism
VRAIAKPSLATRQAQIRNVLKERGEADIGEMAAALGVSEMTIRRDLDRLEEGGYVRRTHGGAVLAERLLFEFGFTARRQTNHAAKAAIAAAAVKLIRPGDCLILDAGTTTLELARLLPAVPDLTVITPSLAVASELQFSERSQTILLGGILRRGNPDLAGEVSEAALDMLKADLAFQGADGIDEDGALYTADLRVAKLDQKIRLRATRTYVLADSSKVGRTALACHGRLQDVTGWITDAGIAAPTLARLRALGTPITVVHPPPTRRRPPATRH